jgi:pre-mRNA-splicing factor 38B
MQVRFVKVIHIKFLIIRKCKEIKKDISKKLTPDLNKNPDNNFKDISEKNEFKILDEQQKNFYKENYSNLDRHDIENIDRNFRPTEIPVNINEYNYNNFNEIFESQDVNKFYDPPFKIYADQINCNLNPLILNNILSCQYFKDEIAIKGFNEIITVIIENVNYAEPWAIGMSGIPSTLFCCLYKLMLLKLTESQVKYLLENIDSPFIRCIGFLYVRYLADPKELWNILSPYLSDQQIFYPTTDRKNRMKMGKYVENLFKELDYYGTRLPRLPTQIERDIKMKLIHLEENYKNKSSIKEKDIYKRRSISRSREKRHYKKHSSNKKFPSSSRSRSDSRNKKNKRSMSKSLSRSRSRSISNSKKNIRDKDNIIKKVKEKERDLALAKGREYAVKPTSYKSSLSTKLPGNSKKRSR